MNVDEIYQEAEHQYFLKNYPEALELFQKAQSLHNSRDYLNYIGCCYLELRKFDLAKSTFSTLMETHPDWERPVMNMGRLHLMLNNSEKALEFFNEALKINPHSEDVYYYLGVYYYQMGNFQEAMTSYEKSLSLDNAQSETHLNLGLCYFKFKMYEKALQEFELAYQLDTNCWDAIYNKGVVSYAMGNYAKALYFCLEVHKQKADDTEVMCRIAMCYYKLNDYTNSIDWGKRILMIEPEHEYANKLVKNVTIKAQKGSI